ncbi:hypothetical protein CtCNB1_3721 [Comamonas thiooxydans]|nr:hypothetical protein CtCNB1_3721 [Comamonas thiooxydans]
MRFANGMQSIQKVYTAHNAQHLAVNPAQISVSGWGVNGYVFRA